ncbi:hypothetical protein J8273_3091 [Carpediemonas membranifera]|uniref:Uncharacterized protein n=1 Tax=Carpediemonas membranifera TaxID=201153 RepID=A0A8J6EAW0_9EUKA|nr:hypothetical protein J8273_3091 [Carpediemonas membranifera]|eukprot:KAG9395515.1 hypothetical protein J8273_3091 [Carpediemonas membranifera]
MSRIEELERVIQQHDLFVGNALALIDHASVEFVEKRLEGLVSRRDETISALKEELGRINEQIGDEKRILSQQRKRTDILKRKELRSRQALEKLLEGLSAITLDTGLGMGPMKNYVTARLNPSAETIRQCLPEAQFESEELPSSEPSNAAVLKMLRGRIEQLDENMALERVQFRRDVTDLLQCGSDEIGQAETQLSTAIAGLEGGCEELVLEVRRRIGALVATERADVDALG